MNKFLLIAAAIIFANPSAPAFAQDAVVGTWQPMAFHDLRALSQTDLLQTLIWPDAIADANAYVTNQLKRSLNGQNAFVTALSSSYQLGDRTIIISTALVRSCDSGANDKGAGIEPSMCPLRIAVLKDGKMVAMKHETGCYADHADPGLPEQNRGDNSYTLFDPKAGTIAYRTIIGGKQVANCDHTYSINAR